ncbi:hypothetical protein KM803_15285 [Clostridium tyrobutyricum]|uniref:hypothetical protein n=1 Tax=Clostridium tyrobutyricum TaxID=1519 RepID=UPI001C393017|nr:hypothetical protein [Clostridium tyrobutyricum]MBV4432668.1 hypothetical protein [Clostridium tyrobutyricum]
MNSNKFKQELKKLENRSRNKYLYFCWKNKIDNSQTKFSEMTKENFMKRYHFSDYQMDMYSTIWEDADEYNVIYRLLMELRSKRDLYKIYNVVKDKALKGDDKAVKTFLLLKKEINKKDIDITDVPQKDNEVKNDIDNLDLSEE